MNTLLLFTRNQLALSFRHKLSWVLHFLVPLAGFMLMYTLLTLNEGAALSGLQSIGMVTYFTMIQAVLLTSLLLKDREQGIDRRIRVSPVRRMSYLAGNGLATLIILGAQVIIFSLFIFLLFGDDIGMPFPGMLAILFGFNITCTGFAFLVCAISDNASNALMKANTLVMIMSLTGGSFLPIQYMDPVLQRIALLMPQYWVMKALRLLQEGSSMVQWGIPITILLLYACFFMALHGAITHRKSAAPGTLL